MKEDLSKVKEMQSEIKKLNEENFHLRYEKSHLINSLGSLRDANQEFIESRECIQKWFYSMSHHGLSYEEALRKGIELDWSKLYSIAQKKEQL